MAKHDCRHWWIIDADNVGVCKYCHSEVDFAARLRADVGYQWLYGAHRRHQGQKYLPDYSELSSLAKSGP